MKKRVKQPRDSAAKKGDSKDAPVHEELSFGEIADILTGEFEIALSRGVIIQAPDTIGDEEADEIREIRDTCNRLLKDYEEAEADTSDDDDEEDDDSFDEDEDFEEDDDEETEDEGDDD